MRVLGILLNLLALTALAIEIVTLHRNIARLKYELTTYAKGTNRNFRALVEAMKKW